MRAFAASLQWHAFILTGLALWTNTDASEIGFSRIVRGWTNYSTGFTTTHDVGVDEFATAATFYTPPYTVRTLEFGTIVIWSGLPPESINFSDFTFTVCFWTSLEHFIADPGQGDFANMSFAQPTSILLDTYTRGGRPAYEIRFPLTNASLVLSNCQTYLIGMIARTDTSRNGELYVPTAGTEGPSDVQAGNIVPFGWQYLLNAGGSTIYHGQLAAELVVEGIGAPPSLHLARSNATVRLSWPLSASCYGLQFADALGSPWLTVTNQPDTFAGWNQVVLPIEGSARYYRLRTPAPEPEPEM
jgi:hypothetical protein